MRTKRQGDLFRELSEREMSERKHRSKYNACVLQTKTFLSPTRALYTMFPYLSAPDCVSVVHASPAEAAVAPISSAPTASQDILHEVHKHHQLEEVHVLHAADEIANRLVRRDFLERFQAIDHVSSIVAPLLLFPWSTPAPRALKLTATCSILHPRVYSSYGSSPDQ